RQCYGLGSECKSRGACGGLDKVTASEVIFHGGVMSSDHDERTVVSSTSLRKPEAKASRPWQTVIRWAKAQRFHLFHQRLHGDFLEDDDVCVLVLIFALVLIIVAVVLKADPAEVRAPTTRALEPELPVGHRVAFCVVGDFNAIEHDDGARAVEGDL